MIEYKTVLIEGNPDAILNAHAVDGWECFAATFGGYDKQGAMRHAANVVWLKRERKALAQSEKGRR